MTGYLAGIGLGVLIGVTGTVTVWLFTVAYLRNGRERQPRCGRCGHKRSAHCALGDGCAKARCGCRAYRRPG